MKQKFAAAKQVMRKVPDGSVDAVYRHYGVGVSENVDLIHWHNIFNNYHKYMVHLELIAIRGEKIRYQIPESGD